MGKLAQQLSGQSQVKVAPGKGCDCQKTKAPSKMKCGGVIKGKEKK